MNTGQSPLILEHLTAEVVADILRRCGYRASVVENGRAQQVHSAAQGLGFLIGFGNALEGVDGQYADCVFQCWIGIQGDLPADLVPSWNHSMRFARLSRQGEHLVLSMDVVVTGGVTDKHLVAQCELWDRVIRDFIMFLRKPVQTESSE